MWIRNSLIILPLVLIVFLLSSWAWVPSSAEISADPSRQDRLILALPGDPNSLNPWFSKTNTDSEVYTLIFEGLASANGNFEIEPCLAETLKVGEDVVIVFSHDDNVEAICSAIDAKLKADFPATYRGISEYNHRDFETGELKFVNRKTGKGDAKPEPKREVPAPYQEGIGSDTTGRGADFLRRRVVRFRATEPTGPKHIPSAVVTDVGKRIEEAVAASQLGTNWVTKFDRWNEARASYGQLCGIEVAWVAPVATPKGELQGTPARSPEGVEEAPAPAFSPKEAEEAQKALEEAKTKHGEALTAAARAKHGDKTPAFAEYLNGFASTRITELPVIEVKLREDVKWHDYATSGRKLDIEDVVFTYSFALDPNVNTDNKSYVDSKVQLRVTSDMTCEILYRELYSPALFHLTYAKILPMHKFTNEEWTRQAILKGRGPAFDGDPDYIVRKALPARELEFTLAPVGTGPFKLFPLNGENLPMWRSGELVRLERNPSYWDHANIPAYRFLDFYVIEASMGQESAEVNFLSGGLDAFAIRDHQVAKYEAMRDKYYVYKQPNLQYEYLAFNLEREPFNDKRVRRALAIAVDVDALIQSITYGQGRRVSGPGYPMLPYYDNDYFPDHTMLTGKNAGKSLKELGQKFLPFSLTEAEAVLKQAGWAKNANGMLMKDGKQMAFDLLYSGLASGTRGKVSALAAEKWRQLGIKVELKEIEFNVFVNERVMTRNYDVLALGWNGGIDFDKRKLWSSDQLPPAGFNFTKFEDPVADMFFKEMLREYDAEKIKEMSHKAFQIIADAQPYIFLFTPYGNVAVDRHLYWAKPVEGPDGKVVLGPDGIPQHEPMSFVSDVQMDWKYGPRSQREQWKRGASIQFPYNDRERAVVSEPTLTGDLKKAKDAEAGTK